MKKLSHYLLSPMMMEGQGRFSVASQQNSVCYLQSVDNKWHFWVNLWNVFSCLNTVRIPNLWKLCTAVTPLPHTHSHSLKHTQLKLAARVTLLGGDQREKRGWILKVRHQLSPKIVQAGNRLLGTTLTTSLHLLCRGTQSIQDVTTVLKAFQLT